MATSKPKGKKRVKKNVTTGIVHIFASFNNTIITITDISGNAVSWASCGARFRGSRKSTPYAAQISCDEACRKAMDNGMKSVEVRVKGPGSGRESALRSVANSGLKISAIRDVTPIPHNGCRPPKRRRV